MLEGMENQLMWIREVFLVILGLSFGFVIAGGIYSFIAMVGVFNRLATRTKTASKVMLYEDVVTFGAGVGNAIYFWNIQIPIGVVGLIVIGLSMGIFVGCLAIALAEVLNVIPTFARRTHLKTGLAALLSSLAVGKLCGVLFQLVYKVK